MMKRRLMKIKKTIAFGSVLTCTILTILFIEVFTEGFIYDTGLDVGMTSLFEGNGI